MFICQVPVYRDDEFVDCLASIVNDIADLHYVDTGIVFGGDMNVDLSVSGDLCYSLLHFAQELGLKFVYEKLPPDSKTFRVESTGASSLIDHFAVSQSLNSNLHAVQVLDSGINLSDHCPLAITVSVPDFTDSARSSQPKV